MNSPVPNVYDPLNAAMLARLAAEAYRWAETPSKPNIFQSSQASTESQPTVIEDAATDTCAIVVQNETDTIIAFRGTANLRNWLTDLDVATVSEGGCKIHAGFWQALDSVEARVVAEIVLAEIAGKRIWLTGHSLGGALAVLCAWKFMDAAKRNPFSGIYTFGQPRVGDGAFRDSYDAALRGITYRVVNAEDLVPHVPWLCGVYRHCGHEAFYEEVALGHRPNATSYQLDRPAWLYALEDVVALIAETVRPTSAEQWLADHHVSNYVNLFSVHNLNLNPPGEEIKIKSKITIRTEAPTP